MKKVIFAIFTLIFISMITPSCTDDFESQEISLEAPAPSNDGNNEGDPDGGDGPG